MIRSAARADSSCGVQPVKPKASSLTPSTRSGWALIRPVETDARTRTSRPMVAAAPSGSAGHFGICLTLTETATMTKAAQCRRRACGGDVAVTPSVGGAHRGAGLRSDRAWARWTSAWRIATTRRSTSSGRSSATSVEHGPGRRSGADLGEDLLRGGERRPGQRLETGIGTRPRSCRGTVGCPAEAQAQRNAAELLILRRCRQAHLEEQRGLRSRVPGWRPTGLPSANPCRPCREPWARAGQHPVAVLPAEPTQSAGN